jgi:dienelactone hydrolase
MKYSILLLLILWSFFGNAQSTPGNEIAFSQTISKPPLNTDAFINWPRVALAKLTNNGNYCGYTVESQMGSMMFLMDTKRKNWKITSTITGWYYFSSDGRKAIWINAHDSLCVATLGTSNIRYMPNTLSFSINGDYLMYQSKLTECLYTYNLNNNRFKDNASVSEQIIIYNDKLQLWLRTNKDKTEQMLIERNKDKEKTVWKGNNMHNIIKDNSGTQLVFTSTDIIGYYYYKLGVDTVVDISIKVDLDCIFDGISHFSKNGSYLFLNMTEIKPIATPRKSVLNLWSYIDNNLQSQQLNDTIPRQYSVVVRLADNHFIRLEERNDFLFLPELVDTVALIRKQQVNTSTEELGWNINGCFSWYLLSLNNERKIWLNDIRQNKIVQLSPSGKYVVYYDFFSKNYFVYETESGRNRCITKSIEENWEKNMDNNSYGRYIGGWAKDDATVFIYGERDIWQIDPEGLISPLNLTNGYGRKHGIIFFLALEEYSHRGIGKNETLILTAFDFDTKSNGFYRKVSGSNGDPDLLTMGPYIYDIKDNPSISQGINYSPIKALNAPKYIVRRMSAKEAPNFFFTEDFKVFKLLSDVQPQNYFNWYRAELHRWSTVNGRNLQGILYKPENFDSCKKYPMIFYYYERKSDELNAYLEPRSLDNGCAINIPYYVSNGYLIFCPDIYYKIGDPMQGTYDAMISAVKYLSSLSYVNKRKIGAQGCSWGGIQTNYIVANTDLFAAACSASGMTNWISAYNSIMGSGESKQNMFETGQFRIGSTLWQAPDVYIKNSVIFKLDKIATPLLLMHTTNDWICDLSDIQQFFIALCRLKKQSWLLMYEGNHGVWGKDGDDFSMRMKEFFDHYLRDYPAPSWMKMNCQISIGNESKEHLSLRKE